MDETKVLENWTIVNEKTKKVDDDLESDGILIITNEEMDAATENIPGNETAKPKTETPDVKQDPYDYDYYSNFTLKNEELSEEFFSNEKVRSYIHKRNNKLSGMLNMILLGTIIITACLAIGHVWGTTDDCSSEMSHSLGELMFNIQELKHENYVLREKNKDLEERHQLYVVFDRQPENREENKNCNCNKNTDDEDNVPINHQSDIEFEEMLNKKLADDLLRQNEKSEVQEEAEELVKKVEEQLIRDRKEFEVISDNSKNPEEGLNHPRHKRSINGTPQNSYDEYKAYKQNNKMKYSSSIPQKTKYLKEKNYSNKDNKNLSSEQNLQFDKYKKKEKAKKDYSKYDHANELYNNKKNKFDYKKYNEKMYNKYKNGFKKYKQKENYPY